MAGPATCPQLGNKTYDQLSFHTERVIKTLKFVESYEV